MAPAERSVGSPEISPSRGYGITLLNAAGAVCIVAALLASPYLYQCVASIQPSVDSYTYAEAAKEVLQGRKLYTDIYFDKGPLTALLVAIPALLEPRSGL